MSLEGFTLSFDIKSLKKENNLYQNSAMKGANSFTKVKNEVSKANRVRFPCSQFVDYLSSLFLFMHYTH